MTPRTPKLTVEKLLETGYEPRNPRLETPESRTRQLNAFIRFLKADCDETKFTKSVYELCNLDLGFGAYYNRDGFISKWIHPQSEYGTARFRQKVAQEIRTLSSYGGRPDFAWAKLFDADYDGPYAHLLPEHSFASPRY